MFRINQPYFGSLYSMCIGAYFAAYTSINWGWPVWLILMGAAALCVLLALIPAFRLAKLGPFPMVIASMAILFIIQTVVKNTNALGARYGLFGMPFMPNHVTLLITYGLLLLIGYMIFHLDYSHIGRAMDAIHFDRDVATALGINASRLSVQFQMLSSAIGGIAGVLYAYTMGGVFPAAFNMNFMMYAITIVVLGGMYTMWGVIISAPFLWSISQFLPKNMSGLSVIIYGVLLIVMLLVRPGGIIDRRILELSKQLIERWKRDRYIFLLDILKYYVTFTGRIGRELYWLTGVIPAIFLIIIGAIIDIQFLGDTEIPVATIIIQIIWLIPSLSVLSRRCHDRNKSALFILLLFIPVIELWPIIELGFLKGTSGENKYGLDAGNINYVNQ